MAVGRRCVTMCCSTEQGTKRGTAAAGGQRVAWEAAWRGRWLGDVRAELAWLCSRRWFVHAARCVGGPTDQRRGLLLLVESGV